MEKEFVPLQESFDMKELGFYKPCFGYHVLENNGDYKLYDKCEVKNYFTYIEAPLYQQAFRWFREKYGLISYIHPFALLEDKGTWCYEITDFSNNWDESFNINSPEEAELECLKKLIEIVKK